MSKTIAFVFSVSCAVSMLATPGAHATTFRVLHEDSASITAMGGDTLTVEVFLDALIQLSVKDYQVVLPCSATAGAGAVGSITFDANSTVFVDEEDGDYLFMTRPLHTSTVDAGSCPTTTLSDMPTARSFVPLGDAVGGVMGPYLATFTFKVSDDAQGTFTLSLQGLGCPASGTYLKDNGSVCIGGLGANSLTINVPTGRCCVDNNCSQTCSASVTEKACDDLGGIFTVNTDCTGGCPCLSGAHCDDSDECTRDVCIGGVCSNPSGAVFGDLVGANGECNPDGGLVGTADILAVINAFGGIKACPMCDGSDVCSASLTAASSAASAANVTQTGRVAMVSAERIHRPGALHQVDVFASEFSNSGFYSLKIDVDAGESGQLGLESVAIDQTHPDYIFQGHDAIVVTNTANRRIDAILIDESQKMTATGSYYLGTFNYRSSKDAKGAFRLNLVTFDGKVLATKRLNFRGAFANSDSNGK